LGQFLTFLEETEKLNKDEKKATTKEACKYLAELLLPIKSHRAIEARIKLVKGTQPDHPITVSSFVDFFVLTCITINFCSSVSS